LVQLYGPEANIIRKDPKWVSLVTRVTKNF
jgi:hypothetical protein